MRGTLRQYFIETNMVGGRGRDRTGDPLLAKQIGENTKVLRWCRLHGQSTKFSLSNCPEVVPRTEERGHNEATSPRHRGTRLEISNMPEALSKAGRLRGARRLP